MGLGVTLFVYGFTDLLGADILERVATTRDFNWYSALEIVTGIGLAYLGVSRQRKKVTDLRNLATSLNEYYTE